MVSRVLPLGLSLLFALTAAARAEVVTQGLHILLCTQKVMLRSGDRVYANTTSVGVYNHFLTNKKIPIFQKVTILSLSLYNYANFNFYSSFSILSNI